MKRWLPDLQPLAGGLAALSLSMNAFSRVPDVIAKLTGLECLDLSCECGGGGAGAGEAFRGWGRFQEGEPSGVC